MENTRLGFFRMRNFLIGLGILVLGGCLLLSQVCRVREAAAAMQCISRQKQMALAIHNYHDAFGHFPPGVVPHPTLPVEQRLSWLVTILPYVEQDSISKRVHLASGWDGESNSFLTGIKIPQYTCPSYSGQPASTATYVGVAGVGPDAATLPTTDRRSGMFGYDRKVVPSDVKDGLSNTLLVLETWADAVPWARGGSGTVRGIDPATVPYVGPDRPFRSEHPLEKKWFGTNTIVVTASMADGSARHFKEGVNPKLLEALATIAGGEEVNGDW
jgi:hypothetical protein